MIELRIIKELYQEKNIHLAIKAYKGISDVFFQEQDNYWILLFTNCKYNEAKTIQEFENYLIGLENC